MKDQLFILSRQLSSDSQQYNADYIEPSTVPKQYRSCSNSAFQKNYPKNIFIPIIEYLAQLGLKQTYEACVGTREKFQGKNVVSLGLICLLISQSWFVKSVDKNILLANLSNKILMNSKIKKKLFHLKVAKAIFNIQLTNSKQFKKVVSQYANKIAIQCGSLSDQLFQSPNCIIYLLRLFLNTLTFHLLKLSDQPLKFSKTNSVNSSDDHISGYNGSKQQYKYLVKQLTSLFNRKQLNNIDLLDAFEEVRNTIIWRSRQLRMKFSLDEGIIDWQIFIDCVVERCFKNKRQQMRITNSLINEWINQFKSKVTTITTQQKCDDKWFGARIFEPIILFSAQI